jgi:hypothetical protein
VPNYAALTDVETEMGKYAAGLTATSTPSETDVTDRIIPDIHGQIDGVLSRRGLATPILAPSSFLDRLKALNALGAAARVVAALFPQAAGPASTTFHEWLQRRYDAGLEMLRNGEGIPDDVLVILNAGGGGLPRSFATSHPDSVSADLDATPGNTIDPVFRRDTKW